MTTFTNLPDGDYTVTISGFDTSRFVFSNPSASFTINAANRLVDVKFQGALAPTGTATGTLTINGQAPSANPTQPVSVTLVPPTGNPFTVDLTGQTGTFTFSQLPAGNFTLRVSVNNVVRTQTFTLTQGQQLQLGTVEYSTLTPAS